MSILDSRHHFWSGALTAAMATVFCLGGVALFVLGVVSVFVGWKWWVALLLAGLSPVAAGMGAFFMLWGVIDLRRARSLRRIEAAGIPCLGKIVAIRSTMNRIRTQTRMGYVNGYAKRFDMIVDREGAPPREVSCKDMLPPDFETAMLPPGTMLPLRVDPEDAREVAIDWPEHFRRILATR